MKRYTSLAGILILTILMGWLCRPDPLDSLFNPDRALTFDGAMVLAERLDEIGDQLSALDLPPMPSNQSQLTLLALEIIPFFHYDEMVGNYKQVPVQWSIFVGERNFHVLGSTRIGDYPRVTINVRYANPWASWFGKQSLFSVMVHELAHSQGFYKFGDQMTEPATQLATLEILAAMSRDGNVWAFPAFVRELQGFADDYLFALALKEGRMDEYRAYLERVGDGIWSRAKFERAMDHWAGDMTQLKMILERYGKVPYILLIEALSQPDYLTSEMQPIPNESHTFAVNDVAWMIQHLPALAVEYPAMLDLWRKRYE